MRNTHFKVDQLIIFKIFFKICFVSNLLYWSSYTGSFSTELPSINSKFLAVGGLVLGWFCCCLLAGLPLQSSSTGIPSWVNPAQTGAVHLVCLVACCIQSWIQTSEKDSIGMQPFWTGAVHFVCLFQHPNWLSTSIGSWLSTPLRISAPHFPLHHATSTIATEAKLTTAWPTSRSSTRQLTTASTHHHQTTGQSEWWLNLKIKGYRKKQKNTWFLFFTKSSHQ